VDGEVIYGIISLDGALRGDLEATQACFRIYNDWVAGFCRSAPDRLKALACVPNDTAENAAAEVRRAARIGLHGVELRMKTAPKAVWHRDWEPLWDAIEETGLPVHFHLAGANVRMPDNPQDAATYQNLTSMILRSMNKMANGEDLGAVILSGVLERHPRITLVMGESDMSWIPHFLWRMDTIVRERGEFDVGLPLKPSEYWRRQCLVTFQRDPVGLRLLDIIGVDNIMWGSDYPHADSVWLRSQEIIAEDFAQFDDISRRKIVHDNTARVYGFNGA
jgi:predicted TIM-barrel fold metal-dependent hydrolase